MEGSGIPWKGLRNQHGSFSVSCLALTQNGYTQNRTLLQQFQIRQLTEMSDPILFMQLQLPKWLRGKESACNVGDAEDMVFFPELGRSPGEGNSNPLQYPCMENSMERGAWQSIDHGFTKESDTTQQLNHHNSVYICQEILSSILFLSFCFPLIYKIKQSKGVGVGIISQRLGRILKRFKRLHPHLQPGLQNFQERRWFPFLRLKEKDKPQDPAVSSVCVYQTFRSGACSLHLTSSFLLDIQVYFLWFSTFWRNGEQLLGDLLIPEG